ncbi:MAG: lipoyl synthase [Thermoplasmata archaeon]|nr:lipoyl synthase [Thermoplasmata archaeon]MCI4353763.1 lipoyl synthase [Thermoplasmata archaeon]
MPPAIAVPAEPVPARLPEWIRVPLPSGQYPQVRATLDELRLATVCREARCPNKSECWSAGTATFMLLGTDCSRRCAFCAVTTHWSAGRVDATEPTRVAEGIRRWGLQYAVLTQVCRDDLPDGGASVLAETVRRIRATSPTTRIELLVGDLGHDEAALQTLLVDPPDVLSHNLETVRELTPRVRDRRASYDGSLELLRRARASGPRQLVTKSSLMLGLGETETGLRDAFSDLRGAGVDLLTLGQYLRPTPDHFPVAGYVRPEEFERWRAVALHTGFVGVEAGPLVRSSYHAAELFERAYSARGT